jgi:hypothetical protein
MPIHPERPGYPAPDDTPRPSVTVIQTIKGDVRTVPGTYQHSDNCAAAFARYAEEEKAFAALWPDYCRTCYGYVLPTPARRAPKRGTARAVRNRWKTNRAKRPARRAVGHGAGIPATASRRRPNACAGYGTKCRISPGRNKRCVFPCPTSSPPVSCCTRSVRR